ncbi:MAG: hypothetical protein Q7J78_05485 [Clostridiales bacterium]|nr:hypothetical protein [Clostridiales bacterium]
MRNQKYVSDKQKLEIIPGTRMSVNWRELISGQDIVLNRLPDNFRDSLRMGNGDIGVAAYMVPECLTLSVAKNDLLDYRMGEPWDPFVALPSSKPAGSIRFRGSLPGDPDCKARLNLWDAEVSTGSDENTASELRTFVSKKRNLIVAEYKHANGQDFDIEIARHQDSAGCIPDPPEFGAAGRDVWVRYKFPPSPDTYPNGFEYVMYGRVLGGTIVSADTVDEFATVKQCCWGHQGASPIETIEGIARVRIKASDPVTLLIAVITTRDSKDPLQAAKAEIESAQSAGLSTLRQEHSQLWHEFWQRSFVQLADRDFLNQQWFLSLYHLACITRPGSVVPGLFGPWTWEDFPDWGNDCHWDYNMQATIWGAYSSNHLELTAAYNDEVFELLPFAKMRSQEYNKDISGAKYLVTTWPINYSKFSKTPYLKEIDFVNPWINGFVAHPLWWYYEYSQDTEFLKECGYPVIKACAEFYESFVQRAPDGKYDMPPTGVWDLAEKIKDSKNSVIDLAFAKMLLKIASAASQVLGLDMERRAQWNLIADNLRDYPTTVIDGKNLKPVDRKGVAVPRYTSHDFPSGEVLVVYENFPVIEYQAPAPIMPIFPSGDIGLDSPQKQRELAHRTLQITPYYLWDDLVMLSMAWVRLGYDQLDVLEKHSRDLQLVNGCQTCPKDSWAGKWVLTHFLGWPIVVNESIVQSYTGQIRIAPVKLKNAVQFAHLRTVGAFLVSGEIRPGGSVSYLAITSEAESLCYLVRPWDGDVRIREADLMKVIKYTEKEGVLAFPTVDGLTYIVDRLDDPWEKQPITVITGRTS